MTRLIAAYVTMSTEDMHDFEAVKEAILKKFEINPETYRQRFRKDSVLKGKMPKELFTRLTGLYERWMRPTGKTREEIGQTIVLEQFLSMINPELKSRIMEHSPASPQQAVEMAEAFILTSGL
uniref:SCAN box domain-containing protein n=1 Tax=Pygocentrus nattereri TaxID=42514 RepID=A0AAR2LX62_PYGNA